MTLPTTPLPNPAPPIAYDPSVERAEDDEAATAGEIDRTMEKIREKTYVDSGHALRSVHAKAHGYLRGELRVASGLPPELAQGLFGRPGWYPVLMRFSTIPGDVLDDRVSVPRGLAMKVLGVEGERLPGSEGDVTQNFLFIDGPAFNAPNTRKFLSGLKLLAATTDVAEGAKRALSATLQTAERAVEAFGGKSATLVALGGHAETHLLGETYFTAAPMRYGAYMAKLAFAPATAELRALKDAKVDLRDRPNGLREAVSGFFAGQGGTWHLQVQLCTDLEAMPIEDSSVEWPQSLSPYCTVATVTVAAQTSWSEARASAVDDGMMFSPWRGLAAHRPLGSVMRARKSAYEQSARFRAARNGRPVEEPQHLDGMPD